MYNVYFILNKITKQLKWNIKYLKIERLNLVNLSWINVNWVENCDFM